MVTNNWGYSCLRKVFLARCIPRTIQDTLEEMARQIRKPYENHDKVIGEK